VRILYYNNEVRQLNNDVARFNRGEETVTLDRESEVVTQYLGPRNPIGYYIAEARREGILYLESNFSYTELQSIANQYNSQEGGENIVIPSEDTTENKHQLAENIYSMGILQDNLERFQGFLSKEDTSDADIYLQNFERGELNTIAESFRLPHGDDVDDENLRSSIIAYSVSNLRDSTSLVSPATISSHTTASENLANVRERQGLSESTLSATPQLEEYTGGTDLSAEGVTLIATGGNLSAMGEALKAIHTQVGSYQGSNANAGGISPKTSSSTKTSFSSGTNAAWAGLGTAGGVAGLAALSATAAAPITATVGTLAAAGAAGGLVGAVGGKALRTAVATTDASSPSQKLSKSKADVNLQGVLSLSGRTNTIQLHELVAASLDELKSLLYYIAKFVELRLNLSQVDDPSQSDIEKFQCGCEIIVERNKNMSRIAYLSNDTNYPGAPAISPELAKFEDCLEFRYPGADVTVSRSKLDRLITDAGGFKKHSVSLKLGSRDLSKCPPNPKVNSDTAKKWLITTSNELYSALSGWEDAVFDKRLLILNRVPPPNMAMKSTIARNVMSMVNEFLTVMTLIHQNKWYQSRVSKLVRESHSLLQRIIGVLLDKKTSLLEPSSDTDDTDVPPPSMKKRVAASLPRGFGKKRSRGSIYAQEQWLKLFYSDIVDSDGDRGLRFGEDLLAWDEDGKRFEKVEQPEEFKLSENTLSSAGGDKMKIQTLEYRVSQLESKADEVATAHG
jgi:hypothetical protein